VERKTIAISLLGTVLDFAGKRWDRWHKWRPNVGLCSQADLKIDELYLMHDNHSVRLAETVKSDIAEVSEHTQVTLQAMNFNDPWDFEEVYAKLFDWCRTFNFEADKNDYLFHITTGTHVVQICSFLLTESRHFPGRIIQTSPSKTLDNVYVGRAQIIDLDLSKYDQLATRFDVEHEEGKDFLKGGIHTKNEAFNALIEEIEKVAIRSNSPILLTGPTGAGKSLLATKIYELKKRRSTVSGDLVIVNCATLKGENAMAALFGHTKGAFTGAHNSREGFLLSANRGLLFLDEIGELGQEEQAMLLHAIEHKSFHPVGSDKPVTSDFQLIAGTNRNLALEIQKGNFRDDLLARINLWTYELPALKDRQEDIPVNIDYELDVFTTTQGRRIQFNKEAKDAFIDFACSPNAHWTGNFRDLSSAITRLCTLADSSRITLDDVKDEMARLTSKWSDKEDDVKLPSQVVDAFSGDNALPLKAENLDIFDRNQLSFVVNVCRTQPSMAAAGRVLFDESRKTKTSNNDSSRLQKYLAKFGLRWTDLSKS
jgi:transcriptional regulatory protein RtcR